MKSNQIKFYQPKEQVNQNQPLVSIVTTVYNGDEYLEETFKSIISQKYKNIEYIVIDGGSTDRTIDIIRKYSDYIDYWISEPDNGMYDGINKGFSHANGEIFAYLNADDMYYPGAIETIVEVFQKNPDLKWITGVGTHYNEKGMTTYVGIPRYYFRSLLKKGLYRGDIMGSIQQESTFWTKELWNQVGGLNKNAKYAGDYELWVKFSEYAQLYQIQTILGGFRSHPNQKSRAIVEYYLECDSLKKIRFKFFWRFMRVPITILGTIIALYHLKKISSTKKPGEIHF